MATPAEEAHAAQYLAVVSVRSKEQSVKTEVLPAGSASRQRFVRAGSATSVAAHQLREARVGEHVAVVAERGKEYGAKTYSFLKGMYGSVAGQVENIARDNGYKVDLGAALPGLAGLAGSPSDRARVEHILCCCLAAGRIVTSELSMSSPLRATSGFGKAGHVTLHASSQDRPPVHSCADLTINAVTAAQAHSACATIMRRWAAALRRTLTTRAPSAGAAATAATACTTMAVLRTRRVRSLKQKRPGCLIRFVVWRFR